MTTPFSKMHGAGNDFVVFDATRTPVMLTPARIRQIADRHFGIGCDQVLVVEAPDGPDVDFVYRIYNADGGEVEACGNGARAFVRFVRERHLTDKSAIRVRTAAGVIEPELLAGGNVRVNMGIPRLTAAEVPFDASGLQPQGNARAPEWRVDVDGETLSLTVCSMGNPHAVLRVADCAGTDVGRLGPRLEHHVRFPARVNVGFMQIVDRQHVILRVWERGAGETLACGSGACAAAVTGIAARHLTSPVEIATRGGMLSVSWEGGASDPACLTGPAVTVYEGEIDLMKLDALR